MTVLGDIPSADDLALLAYVMPTGVVLPFAGSQAEAAALGGYVLCDARALDGNLAANAALWALIGTSYGGTGIASFKVPGLVQKAANGSASRFIVGRDPGGVAAFDSVNDQGGVLDHVHAANTLAFAAHAHGGAGLASPVHGHGHSISAPNHDHGVYGANYSILDFGTDSATLRVIAVALAQPGIGGAINNAGAIGLGGSTANDTPGSRTLTGNTGPSNPPYLAVNWLIKL